MRRKDREIKDMETIRRILEALPIGHLAMNDHGKPYGITMNYFAETQDGVTTLYFHGAKAGRKTEILAANPSVYFFAERDDGSREKSRPDGSRSMTELYLSVAGEGNMESVDEPAEKKRILLALTNKYADKPFESFPDAVLGMTTVWKLILKNITGKSNPPVNAEE